MNEQEKDDGAELAAVGNDTTVAAAQRQVAAVLREMSHTLRDYQGPGIAEIVVTQERIDCLVAAAMTLEVLAAKSGATSGIASPAASPAPK